MTVSSRIKEILHLIQTIFKSDSEKIKNSLEKFHFANSKKYYDVLAEHNMIFLYKNDLHTVTLTEEQKEILAKKEDARMLIDEYSENHYNFTINKSKEESKENEEFHNGRRAKLK
jgi:hypothetical protein